MSASIPASFVAIELFVFGLFGWGSWTAIRNARIDVITLLAACVFGFAIEYLFATPFEQFPAWLQWLLASDRNESGDSYTYGRFLVMFAGVPLWVPLGWGTIIYASLRTSERLGFGFWLVPVAAGLLASSVDLALDPIAGALGFWVWSVAPTPGVDTFFNVPLDNFLGWLMIVGGLSLMLQLAWKLARHLGNALWLELTAALCAIVVALVFAMLLQGAFDFGYAHITAAGTFMLVYGAAGLVTLAQLPWLHRDRPIDSFALGIIGAMHLALLFLGMVNGVYRAIPALIGFQPLLAFASLLAFAWPALDSLRAATRSAETTTPTRRTA